MLRYRLAYIAACLLALFTFIGTNQPAALGTLILLALLLVVCLLSSVALAHTLDLVYTLEGTCVRGDEMLLRIEADHPIFVPSGHVLLRLEVRSVTWSQTRPYEIVLTPGVERESEYLFSCPTDECGKMEVRVTQAKCMGPLGLTSFPIKQPFSGFYLVQPHLHEMAVSLERAPQARYEGVTYDHTRRGQDASETFDIREYQPGDPLRAIHWKLSSKVDDVLVREASQPSNYDTLLLFAAVRAGSDGTSMSHDAANAAYDLAASLSLALFRAGLAHDLAYLGADALEMNEVDSPDSFSGALEELLCTPMATSNALLADAVAHHGYRHKYTKIVLVATELGENMTATLGQTHDVSVVLVTEGQTQTLEQKEAYSVTSIPAHLVPTTKTLSI